KCWCLSTSTPFPYTTLFRSVCRRGHREGAQPAAGSRVPHRSGDEGAPLRHSPQRPARDAVGRHIAWNVYEARLRGAMRTSIVLEDRKSTRLNSSHVSISYAV